MESIIGKFISVFSSSFLPIVFVLLFAIALIILFVKSLLEKRKIHNRLLEIAFERGMTNEKSRIIQQ